MTIWQADLYKQTGDYSDSKTWYLLVCDQQGNLIHENQCLQSEVNSQWVLGQLQNALEKYTPDKIQIFRPQVLNFFQSAGSALGVPVEATRHTPAIKKLLLEKGSSLSLDKAPPQPMPENLWGESWRVAYFQAGEIIDFWEDRPLPILSLPPAFRPLSLGVSSSQPIPGLLIYGGRKSRSLAQWLESVRPVCLDYISDRVGVSGGVVLEAGLNDRWVVLTFEDPEIAEAMENYESRKRACQGLHFLLIQPDDSNVTYTAFWLLKTPDA
ncbi:MAG: hypothetical protein N5P05_001227 [Chroococcopsis gigantea SAG 12.99]|jgi:hypothetical protein|nr:DUF1092 family protein [Chlorogloea purpurea SAG 13.99]MDV2999621.1 hypothetical protein [Chroococcopsis gigantea SAG 12.99]